MFKLNLASLQIYIQNNLEITFKMLKKYPKFTKKPGKIMEKNFVSPEKWEP